MFSKPQVKVTFFIIIVCIAAMGSVFSAQAQNTPQLETLFIQIWPEHDRPETLVIYQGQVADLPNGPVTLSFDLPASVQQMNAVAIVSPEGDLINHPFTLDTVGSDTQRLTFEVDQPRFQFEYYDPDLVVQQNTERLVSFQTKTNYSIDRLRIEFQQPFGAQDMQLQPSPTEVFPSGNGLTYHIYTKNNVSPGPILDVTGQYTKLDNTLTVQTQIEIPQALETSAIGDQDQSWTLISGYVLVGLGVGVLLVAGGLWLFNNKRQGQQVPVRRPAKKKHTLKPVSTPKTPPPSTQTTTFAESKYCHKCGTPYKPDASFCHKCGTARR